MVIAPCIAGIADWIAERICWTTGMTVETTFAANSAIVVPRNCMAGMSIDAMVVTTGVIAWTSEPNSDWSC